MAHADEYFPVRVLLRPTREVKCGCQVWQHSAIGPGFGTLKMTSFVLHFSVVCMLLIVIVQKRSVCVQE